MGKAEAWHRHGMAQGSAQASTGKNELGGSHRAKQVGRQSLCNDKPQAQDGQKAPPWHRQGRAQAEQKQSAMELPGTTETRR